MERQRFYDRTQRNARAKAFYNSAAWRRARERALRRDGGLCQAHLALGKVRPGNHVDHIVPIEQDWARRLDLANLRTLCLPCHNAVRGEQRQGEGGSKV